MSCHRFHSDYIAKLFSLAHETSIGNVLNPLCGRSHSMFQGLRLPSNEANGDLWACHLARDWKEPSYGLYHSEGDPCNLRKNSPEEGGMRRHQVPRKWRELWRSRIDSYSQNSSVCTNSSILREPFISPPSSFSSSLLQKKRERKSAHVVTGERNHRFVGWHSAPSLSLSISIYLSISISCSFVGGGGAHVDKSARTSRLHEELSGARTRTRTLCPATTLFWPQFSFASRSSWQKAG